MTASDRWLKPAMAVEQVGGRPRTTIAIQYLVSEQRLIVAVPAEKISLYRQENLVY